MKQQLRIQAQLHFLLGKRDAGADIGSRAGANPFRRQFEEDRVVCSRADDGTLESLQPLGSAPEWIEK